LDVTHFISATGEKVSKIFVPNHVLKTFSLSKWRSFSLPSHFSSLHWPCSSWPCPITRQRNPSSQSNPIPVHQLYPNKSQSKGGGTYKVLGISADSTRNHRSTGFPYRSSNGIFPHSKRGHPGSHYRDPTDIAGLGAADLPATKKQKPERRSIQIR